MISMSGPSGLVPLRLCAARPNDYLVSPTWIDLGIRPLGWGTSNGVVRVAVGELRYDPVRMDRQRIGGRTYHHVDGRPLHKERYIDGRVQEVTDL
ncbi:MAG: hypothetical protein KDC03_20960 [Flavobacteriales bacterium]|nr:hypothetical protein [Flavobacteriales bacterium]